MIVCLQTKLSNAFFRWKVCNFAINLTIVGSQMFNWSQVSVALWNIIENKDDPNLLTYIQQTLSLHVWLQGSFCVWDRQMRANVSFERRLSCPKWPLCVFWIKLLACTITLSDSNRYSITDATESVFQSRHLINNFCQQVPGKMGEHTFKQNNHIELVSCHLKHNQCEKPTRMWSNCTVIYVEPTFKPKTLKTSWYIYHIYETF